MRLAGQKMLVMGGTSGIGLATAEVAAAAGANVVIAGRSATKLERAVETIGELARGEQVDATDRQALDDLFACVGRLDHLVVAASGGWGAGAFGALTRDDLEKGFRAKFWAQWSCAQAALPHLIDNGSITFVTANSARMGNPATSGLAAINGALGAMILPLAHELGPVRVNAVSPGVIDTPWWNDRPEELKRTVFERVTATAPLRRVGNAADVADAIVFLAGNSYVTGIILDVDGGIRVAGMP